MKLSIIIPVYNCAPWIRACLDSVESGCAALRGCEVEVICVDDGSTDGSLRILKKFGDELSARGARVEGVCDTLSARFARVESASRVESGLRVVVVHQENSGVAAARNRGLELASGDYVWFVDGDDVIAPDALATLVRVIEWFGNPDIVHFDLARFTEDVDYGTETAEPRLFDLAKRSDRRAAYREHAAWLLGSSAAYRRSCFGDMRFVGMKNGEDSIWGRRCFYKARSLVRINRALYGYRQRTTSANNVWTWRRWRDFCRASWVMFKEGLWERSIHDLVILDGLRAIYYAWLWHKKVR